MDPAGYNETDLMVQLTPFQERGDLTQEQIADEVCRRMSTLPGGNLVMAQPIPDRVDEMVTGARADVAVKIFGDDLDTLIRRGMKSPVWRLPSAARRTLEWTVSGASRI